MRSVAVLQARTNSSRLPAKVLLPISGIPMFVMAAKRASNTGREVIVATSTETSDDLLSNLAKKHKINLFRGSLSSPLKRIVDALDTYPDETVVIRLTADNVLPDGNFLDTLEQEFLDKGLQYICCNGVESGLPYGMSAEITYLAHLRDACSNSSDPFEHEHVTPYIRRKYGVHNSVAFAQTRANLRATVDSFDDYLVVAKLFEALVEPFQTPAEHLIESLKNSSYQGREWDAPPDFVLGTAQLGMEYGINNQTGKPNYQTAVSIVKHAISNGIVYLDTARAYKDSERILGNILTSGWRDRVKIITKLDPTVASDPKVDEVTLSLQTKLSVMQSCRELKVDSLDVVMMHRAEQLWVKNNTVLNTLISLRDEGLIGAIGVSVQSPIELRKVLNIEEVSFIQLPFNILDDRWEDCVELLRQTRSKRQLVVHARSIYLQGLLLSKSKDRWSKANVNQASDIVGFLEKMSSLFSEGDVARLCMSFVKAVDWIDACVIGVETVDQLIGNCELCSHKALTEDQMNKIINERPAVEEHTLNPAFWGIN